MLNVNISKQLSQYELNIEFNVSNEIIALLGPSGAGKTTILNCIAGLMKADDGMIKLDNSVLFHHGKINIATQKREIGYLFQDYALFPHMTVWKNIAYGMKTKSFAKQLMIDLRIDHLKDKYPHNISGGEKQRTAIARALSTEPKALLLDEPFSALDDDIRLKSHEELIQIHKKWRIPIILVTHNKLEAKKLANRILYINNGMLMK